MACGEHGLEQQRRTAITEIVDQRRFEFRRVLIEQGTHIGRRHARKLLGAEQHQPQACTVPVVGIGRLRLAKRRDGPFAFAELLPNVSQREPRRGKAGCKVGGLQQQVGGGNQIALQLQVARKIEPAVGNQIAGRHEQADGHGLNIRHCRARPGNPSNKNCSGRWMRGSSPRMTVKIASSRPI